MNPSLNSQSDPTEVETRPNQPAGPHPHSGSSEFYGRLIPLCDGRPGLRATLQIQAQSTDPQSPALNPLPVIDFVSSDATLDRYDEIISPAGWRLDNYRHNPVFQNAHQYGDIIFTLGKALITEVRTTPFPHLFQRIEFAVDVNPMARVAYGLYRNKFLNAVSVGFIPIRWENGDGSVASGVSPDVERGVPPPGTRHLQIHGLTRGLTPPGKMPGSQAGETPAATAVLRQARRTYVEQELLEVSAVGIPANPEALQLGLKNGAIEKTDLKALLELLVEEGRNSSVPIIPPPLSIIPKSSLGPRHPHTPIYPGSLALLQLARALRDLLRRS